MESWPNDAGFDTDYEEHEPVALVVKGKIPYYVAGVLYRTGPLGFKTRTEQGNTWEAGHWFDGFSCIHRFTISFPDDSATPRVTYNSRRTVDDLLEYVRKTGKLDVVTFGAKRDPCESFFRKVMTIFKPTADLQNIGVTVSINMPGGNHVNNKEKPTINGHTNGVETLHLKSDASILNQVDPETLEPRGVCNQRKLHPKLTGPLSAAHAKTDPATGDFFNFNLQFGYKPTYRIFRTSASTGKTEILATFPGQPAYIHSLFITEHYVILCIWNSHITWRGLSILYHRNMLDAISPFDPSSKAKWYVVDRCNGKGLVATYESDPFFCFHTVNAWEVSLSKDATKTDIICELSLYENLDQVHRFYYNNLMSTHDASKAYAGKKRLSMLPRHAQFRLPAVDSKQSSKTRPAELLFKADPMLSMELPTINPSYFTHKHRYSYGVVDRLKSSFVDGIIKFDNVTQKSIFWDTQAHTPGEPIFVADPEGTEEDDGVLLSVVLDGVEGKSYLLVLRAKDLVELGKAEMNGPMSFGFHGAYKAMGRGYTGDL
ncbi:hypothetical protein N0V90_011648 [Kalmusia sp. IMI 367209]|nr:hypothetical protein N0V90_011648 [Kalmusia sp. IMI 367209]